MIDMNKAVLSFIMKRAWEIKKEEDRKQRNICFNHNIMILPESKKAIFGICLKMAWAEYNKSDEIQLSDNGTAEFITPAVAIWKEKIISFLASKNEDPSKYDACAMAQKIVNREKFEKTDWSEPDGTVCFNLWMGYGKIRAYYKCSWKSKYANGGQFVEL